MLAQALQWLSKLVVFMKEKSGYISNIRVTICHACKALMAESPCPNCKALRFWILLPQLLGGHDQEPQYKEELTAMVLTNLGRLLERVNLLLGEVIKELPSFEVRVTSGWRPVEYNKKIGGSAGSKHCIGKAVDLSDPEQILSKFLANRVPLLEKYDLAMEHPEATPNWCHIQWEAPKSGNRVFRP